MRKPCVIQAFSIALPLATIANSRTPHLIHTGAHNSAVSLTQGFQRAFLVGSGFALVGAILVVVLISGRDSREHAAAARAEGMAEPAAAG